MDGNVRLDMSGYSQLDSTGASSRRRSRRTVILAVFAVVAIIALSIGLAVSLSKHNNSDNANGLLLPTPVDEDPATGTLNLYGRTFHYEVAIVDADLTPRFRATVRDVATGEEAIVYGKTADDALEYGVEEVYQALIDKGIAKEPSEDVEQFVLVVGKPDDADDHPIDGEDSEAETVLEGSSKKGVIEVYGRKIQWKVKPYIRRFKLRYSAKATDVLTGISAQSSRFKSGKGAVKDAVDRLVAKLIEQGIIVVPQEQNYKFVPDGIPTPTAETINREYNVTRGKSGQQRICGREIWYSVRQVITPLFKIDYECRAVDIKSGFEVKKKNGGAKRACEMAIGEVIRKVMEAGHPIDPNDNCGGARMQQAEVEYSGGFLASAQVQLPAGDDEPVLDASKSGDITVLGRTIRYKVSGYVIKLKWRYKATATDVATGISHDARGFKSGRGAVENAVKGLIQKLIEGGHIQPPAFKVEHMSVGEIAIEWLNDGEVEEDEFETDTAEPTAVTLQDVQSGVEEFISELGQDEDDDEDEEVLSGPRGFSKSGREEVYGRWIRWEVKGRVKKFKWRYKAHATDEATGIERNSNDHGNAENAVREAVTRVFETLNERCIFPPRPC